AVSFLRDFHSCGEGRLPLPLEFHAGPSIRRGLASHKTPQAKVSSYPHKQIHNSMIRQPAKIQGSTLKRMFPGGDTKMVKGEGGSGWIHKQFLFLHCIFVSRLSACSRRAIRFSVEGWLRYRASVTTSG